MNTDFPFMFNDTTFIEHYDNTFNGEKGARIASFQKTRFGEGQNQFR